MSSDRRDGGAPPEGYEYLFVKSFFHKGLKRRVYAHEYGKQCFVLLVKSGGRPKKKAA